MPITKVSCNPRGTILVTGSEDRTVFLFQFVNDEQLVKLEPIGFIQLESAVSYITWKPNYVSQSKNINKLFVTYYI